MESKCGHRNWQCLGSERSIIFTSCVSVCSLLPGVQLVFEHFFQGLMWLKTGVSDYRCATKMVECSLELQVRPCERPPSHQACKYKYIDNTCFKPIVIISRGGFHLSMLRFSRVSGMTWFSSESCNAQFSAPRSQMIVLTVNMTL